MVSCGGKANSSAVTMTGPMGAKWSKLFSKVPLLVGRLDIPGRDIIQDGIAKDIVRGFFLAYIFAVLSDDDGKFAFVIKFADDIEMTVDGSIRIDAARDPFGKVDGHVPLLDLFFRVFLRQFLIVGGIVDSQADDVIGRFRNGCQDLDPFYGDGGNSHAADGKQFLEIAVSHEVGHIGILVGGNDKLPSSDRMPTCSCPSFNMVTIFTGITPL